MIPWGMMTHEHEEHLKHLQNTVIAGGGCFLGLQETISPEPSLVLFTSEVTSSTYALPDNEFFTVNAVQERLRIGDAAFNRAHVPVPRFILKELHDCLVKAEAHLDEYLNVKSKG